MPRIRHPIERIPRTLLWIGLLVSAIATSACFWEVQKFEAVVPKQQQIVFAPIPHWRPGWFTKGIVPFSLARTTDNVNEILEVWSNQDEAAATSAVRFDFRLIACYVVFLWVLCGLYARAFKTRGDERWREWCLIMAWFATLACIADAVENVGMLNLLQQVKEPWPQVVHHAAVVKFAQLALISCFLATASVRLLLMRTKSE